MSILSKESLTAPALVTGLSMFGHSIYNIATLQDQPRAPEAGTITRIQSGEIEVVEVVTYSYSENGLNGYHNAGKVKIIDPKTATACDYSINQHSLIPTFNGDFSNVVKTGKKLECGSLTQAQVSCFNNASNKGQVVTLHDSSDSFLGIPIGKIRMQELRGLCVA